MSLSECEEVLKSCFDSNNSVNTVKIKYGSGSSARSSKIFRIVPTKVSYCMIPVCKLPIILTNKNASFGN